jgi:ABC-type sugar transport system substrate-binding protein
MKKKLFGVLLCVALMMIFAVGCGGSDSESTDDAAAAGDDAAATEEESAGASYVIGYNNFGVGAYPLDLNEKETTYAIETAGSEIKVANDNFTVDNVITDVKNLISSNVDGVVVWCAADTLYNSLNDLMKSSGKPFVLGDKYPTSEKTIEKFRENELFAGAVSTDDNVTGQRMAERAFEDGHKTALIVGAAVGDTNHDARVKGFTEKFEELGGKVLGVVRCADPSEAVQKSGDLLAAHKDADCLYGSGGDYSNGALSAMESAGIEMPVYGTDVDPNVIEAIKEGKISAATGAAGTYCGTFAALLLINYLDGHPILNDEGKAPATKGLKTIMITKDNVDDFEANWINDEAFSPEELQSLLYRYNPDVTWADYEEMIDNYDFETRMEAKGKKAE